MRKLIAACLLAGATAGWAAEPVKFTQPPAASADAGGVKIEFAVDRATDVAVAIADGQGRVLRHLAAGLLGPNAPAPLAKDSLKQTLAWDRKDDLGNPVAGAVRVKVSAGLSPAFDRVLGHDPMSIGDVVGLAAGPGGELFVVSNFGNVHPNDASASCRVFDRQGKYLRTILPYPANLPDDKLAGLRRLTLPGGRKIPYLVQAETRSFYPGVGNMSRQRPVVTRDGRVILVGIQEISRDALRYAQAGPTIAVMIRADGSVPDPVVGPLLAANCAPSFGCPSLALSPDEKTLYFTGVYIGSETKGAFQAAVFRCGLADKQAAVFIGNPTTQGDDATHLSGPRGVATDAEGNIYVADCGNNRIAAFKPDGSPLAQVKVAKPEWVEVSRKTGAIYVLGGSADNAPNTSGGKNKGNPPNVITKFDGWKSARQVAQVKLPNQMDGGRTWLYPVMALDDSADPTVLWAGSPTFYNKFTLLRIEDKGGELAAPADVLAGAKGVGRVLDVHADPAREEVYTFDYGPAGLSVTRFNGLTGERSGLLIPPPADTYKPDNASLGADGRIYAEFSGKRAGTFRFDRDGKIVPFKDGDRLAGLGSLRLRGRGVFASARGDIYQLWQKPKDKLAKGDAEDANNLAVFAVDGTLKSDKLIDSEIRGLNSIRADAAGNLYLAIGARPDKTMLPDDFAGMDLGGLFKYNVNSNAMNWYPYLYGSIVKMGPEGGEIRTGVAGGSPINYAADKTSAIKGAVWMYPQASVIASWRTKAPDVCLCESPCFALDGFGRSFFPDAARFQAGVLDSAGNELCRFGDYGNADSAGPGSRIPTPAIPIHWVHGIGVSDQAVYLGDRLARRIVRVKLCYQAETVVDVK